MEFDDTVGTANPVSDAGGLQCETPVEVCWDKIVYSVQVVDEEKKPGLPCFPTPTKSKTILNGCSGILKPGTCAAIIGPSGCGKTSLLCALAGKLRGGELTGQVLFNGEEQSKALGKVAAFVAQDDNLLATMTVREALAFSAQLRLPKSMSKLEKTKRVEQVIKDVRLQKCADTIIGTPDQTLRGISGGERKRTSIGMELISNPSLLFLDEPTSGLDAFTALEIISLLQNLAERGHTIAASIHQPSAELFFKFNTLLLMADGNSWFFGPTTDAVEYFNELGYVCPQLANPADFFMTMAYQSSPDGDAGTLQVDKLADAWRNAEKCKALAKEVANPAQGGINIGTIEANPGFCEQFAVLFVRHFKNTLRNKLLFAVKIGQTLFLGTLLGAIYANVEDTQKGVQNRTGSLFFIAVQVIISNTFPVILVFFDEKGSFIREYNAGMYSVMAYFASRSTVELPFLCLFVSMFGAIAYWMIGFQQDSSRFWNYELTLVQAGMIGNAMGICIGCSFGSLASAQAASPAIIMPLMIFSGFVVNLDTVLPGLAWVQHISPMKYTYQALVNIEFEDLPLRCDHNEIHTLSPAFNGTPSVTYCPVSNGNDVITSMSLDDLTPLECNLVLLVFFLVLRVLAGLLFWRNGTKP